jgi:hypothetical protein
MKCRPSLLIALATVLVVSGFIVAGIAHNPGAPPPIVGEMRAVCNENANSDLRRLEAALPSMRPSLAPSASELAARAEIQRNLVDACLVIEARGQR